MSLSGPADQANEPARVAGLVFQSSLPSVGKIFSGHVLCGKLEPQRQHVSGSFPADRLAVLTLHHSVVRAYRPHPGRVAKVKLTTHWRSVN